MRKYKLFNTDIFCLWLCVDFTLIIILIWMTGWDLFYNCNFVKFNIWSIKLFFKKTQNKLLINININFFCLNYYLKEIYNDKGSTPKKFGLKFSFRYSFFFRGGGGREGSVIIISFFSFMRIFLSLKSIHGSNLFRGKKHSYTLFLKQKFYFRMSETKILSFIFKI